MMVQSCRIMAAAAVLTLSSAGVGSAAEAVRACFSPEALAAKAGEEVPVHKPNPFTPPDLSQASHPAPIDPALRGSIRRVALPAGEKLIALTFDLCEQPGEIAGYDGRIVDLLRREGVRATFFAGGKWLQSHPERAEQLLSDPMFAVGNHSETHKNLRLVNDAERRREIVGPEIAYEQARKAYTGRQCAAGDAAGVSRISEHMRLFRFPYGACNAASLAAVNDAGLLAIQWDVSTGDPDPHLKPGAMAADMLARARPGSIIVGHANGRGWHTFEALAEVLPKLKAKGFSFVKVSELLARGKPIIAESCFDAKPGDSDRYDNLANFALSGHGAKASGAGGANKPATRDAPARLPDSPKAKSSAVKG